jgi:hypothetical protein
MVALEALELTLEQIALPPDLRHPCHRTSQSPSPRERMFPRRD